MDRIEYHVETTQNHVSEGQQQLKTAQEYQSKARKVRYDYLRLLDIAAHIWTVIKSNNSISQKKYKRVSQID